MSAVVNPHLGKKLQLELARLNEASLADPQATPRTIDFSHEVDSTLQHPSGKFRDIGIRPLTPEGFALNKQQIYRRVKRAKKHLDKLEQMGEAEKAIRYRKPLAEWDAEELAMGRPRDSKGKFTGPRPAWISGEIHEEAMERFTSVVKTGMRLATVDAIKVIGDIITDDSTDNRGRPLVAASTKLQAATFLIEHVVGKPTQRIENDVSVKLQGILGTVMVNPTEEGYTPAHLPGITMQLAELAGEEDEDFDERSEE